MYWRHFDLSAEPFSLTPDPAFLYLSSVHAEAYAALTVGLRERRGLIAMIGEVGTGKTTLIYSLLSGLGPEIHTAYISNARLSFDGILRSALRDFGVDCDSVHVSDLLDAFNQFLNRCAEDGTTAALVIDEAQNLSRDTFEDLRLLTNFETYKHKLLQIVLVGQPELDSKLRDPALRQVADRIAVRCHVNPLRPQEVRQYIQHRLAAAGGSIDIFTETALRILVRRSRGIPRSINILGHNAMLFAYGSGRTRVTRRDSLAAIREREGRGLVRFEAGARRWLSWFPRRGSGETGIFSYSRLLLLSFMIAAVAFAVTTSIGTTRREPPRGEAAREPKDVAAPAKHGVHAPDTTSGDGPQGSLPAASGSVTVEAQTLPVAPRPPHLDSAAIAGQQDETADSAPEPAPANTPAALVVERRDDPEAPDSPVENPQIAAVEPAASTSAVVAPAHEQALLAVATPIPAAEAAPEPEPAPASRTSASKPVPAPSVAAKEASAATPAGTAKQKAGAKVARSKTATATDSGTRSARVSNAAPSSAGTTGADARVVKVRPGSSLSNLIADMYGTYDPGDVPRIQALNPQLKDPDYIVAGDQLRFPAKGKAAPSQPGNRP